MSNPVGFVEPKVVSDQSVNKAESANIPCLIVKSVVLDQTSPLTPLTVCAV